MILTTKTGNAMNITNNAAGAIFNYNVSTSTFTKRIDFNASNGGSPNGSLMLAANDNLYGLTTSGGISNGGTLFEYNFATAVYTKKIDLNASTGTAPSGAMIEAIPGKLYGLTRTGGTASLGTIFSYAISLIINFL